ncbi:MAG: sigma 54-interacting transcriptional regulator [Planctomycetota bacterium]|jgi:transcriptional regulator with PAS, ATPase and Fis domain
MKGKPTQQPDRRKYARADLQLPVEFYSMSGGKRLAAGTTLNVSAGGLLVQCPDADDAVLAAPFKVHVGGPLSGRSKKGGLFRARSLRVEGRAPLRCAVEVLGAPPAFLLAPELIGKHLSIVDIKKRILNIANYDVNVLIQGESGTGKNVVADLIHQSSRRAGFPAVRVNCPAIPENLMESVLFGHEKGAFTDASVAQPGLFRVANRGTLVFDEISAIPPGMQAKLLQAIEEKKFIPVGSCETAEVDVRIVAITNDDLEERIDEGTFREDLFYRLKEISLTVPPLRLRASDIPLLADHFLRKYSTKFTKEYVPINEALLSTFQEYSWPGNVRELENTIKSGVIMGRFSIPGLDRPQKRVERAVAAPDGAFAHSARGKNMQQVRAQAVAGAEKQMVLQALKNSDYNKTRAAAELGVSYRTLLRKMKRYEIRV